MTPRCLPDELNGGRVLDGHRDDCTDTTIHRACLPCTALHCVICRRGHVTNDHPQTCPSCVGRVRDDLEAIQRAYGDLQGEALEGGNGGRPFAAAAIPGGVAQVLRGPAVPFEDLVWRDDLDVDHRPDDAIPPLAVLAWWEDSYRAHLGLSTTAPASVPGATRFLLDHLTDLAQRVDGPDWAMFAREVGMLRHQLELALHDEKTPQWGVACFECGERLVRWFRDGAPCKHPTPARDELAFWLRLGYPEAVPAALVRAARQPCGGCDQGGIRDPEVGLSWECPGCRREYTAAEYLHAVRRDLVEASDGAAGWCAATVAADAASTLAGAVVPVATVRKWVERGQVASCCPWSPGRRSSLKLVFWPDVAEAALEMVARRRRRAHVGGAA